MLPYNQSIVTSTDGQYLNRLTQTSTKKNMVFGHDKPWILFKIGVVYIIVGGEKVISTI